MYSSQVQGRDDSVVGLARQRRAAARAARRARPRAARDPAPPAGARPAVQRASGNTRTCMQPLPWPSRAAGAPAATCAHTCTRLQQAAPRARRVILMPKRKWSSALPANSAACSAGLPAGAPRRRGAARPAPPHGAGPPPAAPRPARRPHRRRCPARTPRPGGRRPGCCPRASRPAPTPPGAPPRPAPGCAAASAAAPARPPNAQQRHQRRPHAQQQHLRTCGPGRARAPRPHQGQAGAEAGCATCARWLG